MPPPCNAPGGQVPGARPGATPAAMCLALGAMLSATTHIGQPCYCRGYHQYMRSARRNFTAYAQCNCSFHCRADPAFCDGARTKSRGAMVGWLHCGQVPGARCRTRCHFARSQALGEVQFQVPGSTSTWNVAYLPGATARCVRWCHTL